MTASETSKAHSKPHILTLRGRLTELRRPLVMGILNLTPDSFFAESRTLGARDAAMRVRAMLEAGADIIDVGACSTRPGAESPSAEEEMRRLEEPMEEIRRNFPDAVISLDTFRAEVADEGIRRWGIDIINDVSGGRDPEMFGVAARHKTGYILMHSRGNSADMDGRAQYDDVTADVVSELAFRLAEARLAGVCNVIVDPGFGFAKTVDQNLRLLAELDRLEVLGCPILAGISRKRMAREASGCDAADSLTPTIALNAVALMKGANIIRVHDVREAALTARTIGRLLENN